jgi:hypothetical protein
VTRGCALASAATASTCTRLRFFPIELLSIAYLARCLKGSTRNLAELRAKTAAGFKGVEFVFGPPSA